MIVIILIIVNHYNNNVTINTNDRNNSVSNHELVANRCERCPRESICTIYCILVVCHFDDIGEELDVTWP